MAAMVELLRHLNDIIIESYAKKNEANEGRVREYAAAVKIQSWFRATRSAVFVMKLNYYHSMATKIQMVWRGYRVRKCVFDYYSYRHYLEALQVKNDIIRSDLFDFAEKTALNRKRIEESQKKEREENEAKKHHHLVSTHVMPGIYNSPYSSFISNKECILRSVKLHSSKKNVSRERTVDPINHGYGKCLPPILPPLIQRIQGPFRQPDEVQSQRYKPFQPSLRVSTDFYSLDEARKAMKSMEWVTRVNDDIFQPFTRRRVAYEKLLYTTSDYGHLPYGHKHFREENHSKYVGHVPFKLVIPTIPLFDKLNATYSNGQA